MASSSQEPEVNCSDFTKCAICFEQFKTPRYLPCSHSFCHECLSTHIVSTCNSKEDPVGFRCPLCRNFIPVENFLNGPINWAREFPVNEILSEVSKNQEKENHCDTCKRDDEEQEASRYCLICKEKLCDMCAKYHRRILLTKDHEVISLEDLKLSPVEIKDKEHCFKHAERKIEFLCKDHFVPCCTMCICVEHRKCSKIGTIKEAAEKVRNGEFDNLVKEVIKLEDELKGIKSKQEENITQLEANTEEVFKLTESLFSKVQNHIERLKNDYLNNLSSKAKEHKEALRRNAESNSERITYLKEVVNSLESLKDELNEATYVAEFHKSSQKYKKLKENQTKNRAMLFKLASSFESKIIEIEKVKIFGDFYFTADYIHAQKNIKTTKPATCDWTGLPKKPPPKLHR
ncbi:E3 ubiquitin-protein ligase TRIM45-like [Saccostrea echinata]|uniref:E3 ubiquitin-protein ligase TRIM45-like n=1 Tax=Saccostrea echinata TaxID=191078 RepID=UPI002A82A576|nr:E3 ubiquitin-protein ligase TRIM45-like [Saccostrea echinata]